MEETQLFTFFFGGGVPSFALTIKKLLAFFLSESDSFGQGESFADVHAPWGNCFRGIPRNGSTILEIPCD